MRTRNFAVSTILLIILVGDPCARAADCDETPNAQPQVRVFENRLQPFTTDGCSRFPDGVPWADPTKWRKCCVLHDIAYWKGGTSEERGQADRALGRCVARQGYPLTGDAVYLGVVVGGTAGFPTSWHWGYGWVIDRGTEPLRPDEMRQVRELSERIPANLDELEVKSQPTIRNRETLSGNRCLDLAVVEIQRQLGRSFSITEWKETNQEKADGFWKSVSIKPDGCREPFRFRFQLLRRNACFEPTSELLARGRIRMTTLVRAPDDCR